MHATNNKRIHPGLGLLLAMGAAVLLGACASVGPGGGGHTGPTTTAPGQTGSTRGPGTTRAPATADEPLPNGPIVLAVPLSGQLAQAGAALRAGFNAGRDNSNTNRRVEIVDSSFMSADAIVAAADAQQAALIVGPLDKNKVSALAQRAPDVAVLALNQIDDMQAPPLFYRYALAPEDDARTAAQQAAAQGWHNALALAPQGDWGSRVLAAFRDAFDTQGGQLVDSARFDPNIINHKAAIRAVLSPYHSGTPVDFIFIAARPEHARMLRSQLRFYHAATLPVIGTSDIYAGTPAPRKDEDLNGVAFATLPWMLSPNPRIQALRSQALEHGSTATRRFPQLYAMGIDAWRLTSQWLDAGLSAGTRLPGLTGALEILPDGRIRRHLAWARFDNGVAKLVQPVESGDTMPNDWDNDSTAAPAGAQDQGTAATLESQVWTNTYSTGFEPVAPADTAATVDPPAVQQPRPDHDNADRQQRAAEISRLINRSNPDTAATDNDSAASPAAGQP